jgi:hypothetical protein
VENKNNIPGNDNNSDSYRNGVPEGYFDSFNERLFAKLELEEELKEFPTLSALAKENPFSTPENYFGSLEQKVNARIGSEAKIVSIGSLLNKYKYAIAAVFVLAFGSSLFFSYYRQSENPAPETACLELACLTKEDIVNSTDFSQISLGDLETIAGQDIRDSLNAEINKDVVEELIQHPEEIGLTEDEDLEL